MSVHEPQPYDGKPADVVVKDSITWLRVKDERLGFDILMSHEVMTAKPLPNQYQIKVDAQPAPEVIADGFFRRWDPPGFTGWPRGTVI